MDGLADDALPTRRCDSQCQDVVSCRLIGVADGYPTGRCAIPETPGVAQRGTALDGIKGVAERSKLGKNSGNGLLPLCTKADDVCTLRWGKMDVAPIGCIVV